MKNNKGVSIRQEFGEKIRKMREKMNLTQEEVAKNAGMSSNYFAKIERGEINATLETIYKIVKSLKAKPSDIFPS